MHSTILNDVYFYSWLITTCVLAVTSLIFLVLYIQERKERVRTEKHYEKQMMRLVEDYEKRFLTNESKLAHLDDWVDMLIQRNPLISEKLKKELLDSYKRSKEKTRHPRITGED